MRFLCRALCVLAFACVYSFPVRANDVQFAAGTVCDTAEQVTMFGSLYDSEGAEKAMAKVNEDAKDPQACVAVQFAYVEVKRGAVIKIANRYWAVTEVQIVAVGTPQGLLPVQPQSFYTLLPAEGHPA